MDETTVRVKSEVAVVEYLCDAVRDIVVEADVEHRVHHARHRELCATPAREKKRVCGVTKGLPCQPFHSLERRCELVFQSVWESLPGVEVGVACIGGDRETRRDRNLKAGHVCKVGAFATKETSDFVPVPTAAFRCSIEGVEAVYPACRHGCLPKCEYVDSLVYS